MTAAKLFKALGLSVVTIPRNFACENQGITLLASDVTHCGGEKLPEGHIRISFVAEAGAIED